MTASTAISRGRTAASALMVDACTITRGQGATVLDPNTGEYVTTPGPTVYSGPCRVKPNNPADQVVDAGGQAVTLLPFIVSVPVTATVYKIDDRVTITVSALDPALVGTVLRVRQTFAGSHITARRLGCEVDAG